jgi:Xaa-Pro aminopeptidase
LKHDIDRLMKERGIDATVVVGKVLGNPTMFYVVNGAKLSSAIVVRKRDEQPVLLCGTMEREEAEASGLRTVDTSKYDYRSMLADAGGDQLKATVSYYRAIFQEFGVTGRVGFYGVGDVGRNIALFRELEKGLPGVSIMGEFKDDVFLTARGTKGTDEIERIKRVGKLTCEVVDHMRSFLASHGAKGGTLVRGDGKPLTIGDCKAEIRTALASRQLVEAEETIFAIGRDAGIPHSRGNEADPIALGKTIVFDIFPQEQGGGYFFDFTRTFVIGEAPAEVLSAYRELEECFDAVAAKLKAGEKASLYQTLTCDFFEKRGRETIRTNPQVRNGYVHSLGHGIGLEVHERPTLSDFPGNDDVLAPGAVFTFEPGLYYPDKGGWGMRIEDIYCVTEDGRIVNLTNYPRDLVLEV